MQPLFPRPSQNHLLAALPAADWQALSPLLEWVELPRGMALYDAGSALSHVYFPTTAIVSLTSLMKDGASAEIAVVGHEGIVGVCAYMGEGCSLSSAVVQGGGQALRMRAAAIREASRASAPLMQALLRYTQALFAHMAQTSACSRHHALDQQLCRWLLLHLDRLSGSEMAVTQERIAHMLGVRRESVTVGALTLQKAGLIRYGRGRIAVLDRAGLEARCCECYAVVKGAYDRLLQAEARPSACAAA
ncbi:MAG: Crp/Fnr family transcriptional regulator [Rubrivivax sp.]|nr:Crp/Fnr family transcriptional regulator [Rubrivivax sp.]